jgi:hypothetical protein
VARISVGTLDLKANISVAQTVEVLEGFQKDRRLLELLRACKPTEKVIIFVLYKKEAVRVEQVRLGFSFIFFWGVVRYFSIISDLCCKKSCCNRPEITAAPFAPSTVFGGFLLFYFCFKKTIHNPTHAAFGLN